jgi:DNA mismatch repair protein MutS
VHLDATEYNDSIVFLHSVQDGPASQSYGIQVAKLAGIPTEVIQLARQELALLEAGGNGVISPEIKTQPSQTELFLPPVNPELQKRLNNLRPDELSPKQALDLIYELKTLL